MTKVIIRCLDCHQDVGSSDEDISEHLNTYHTKPEFEIRIERKCKHCGREVDD